MAKDRYVAYVGTYTHGSSVGIHIFDVDAEKGKMTERKVVPINNPYDLIVNAKSYISTVRFLSNARYFLRSAVFR